MEVRFPTSAGALGKLLKAEVIGDAELQVTSLSPLSQASEGSLTFIGDRKYQDQLTKLKKTALLTKADLVDTSLPITYVVVPNPQQSFMQLSEGFIVQPNGEGISPLAQIHPSVKLGEGCSVGPFTVLEEGVTIGARTKIAASCYLGKQAEVGEDCALFPRVTVLDRVIIGNRVRIFSGTVLGADGFGFIPAKHGAPKEVPQIGTVVVEDDVKMGANCTVDRATVGVTRIGRNVKMDDHVHIGHNATISENCVLCAQCVVGGSAILEENVVLAGHAGVADHTTIGARARLGGACAAPWGLEGDQDYFLTPAVPLKEALRIHSLWRKLPEVWSRLKKIEKRLEKEGFLAD